MRKKKVAIGKKLFLQKETVALLGKEQQLHVVGGVNTRQLVTACLTYTLSTVNHPATCQG